MSNLSSIAFTRESLVFLFQAVNVALRCLSGRTVYRRFLKSHPSTVSRCLLKLSCIAFFLILRQGEVTVCNVWLCVEFSYVLKFILLVYIVMLRIDKHFCPSLELFRQCTGYILLKVGNPNGNIIFFSRLLL